MRDGAGDADSLLQQPFFQRNSLLNSPGASGSTCSDHSPGLVPFLWETSPGLPKPYTSLAGSTQDLATPRLPLPPILQSPHSLITHRQLLPAGFMLSPSRRSFSSKMSKVLRGQRSSSQRFIDVSAVCALESVESCEISDRKDVLSMRQGTSTLKAGKGEDSVVAESLKTYHGHCEPNWSPRSGLNGNIFSPSSKPTSSYVVSSFSSASVPRVLCSVSPSSLMTQNTDSSGRSSATLPSREQPASTRASDFAAKMASQNDECSKKSGSHSNSSCALAGHTPSALDQWFSRHENVFPEDDLTCRMTIKSSRSGSDGAVDENVARLALDVQFPLEFAAISESNRRSPSILDEEFHRHQNSEGPWEPWNKRKKAQSITHARHSSGVPLKGASNDLQQVKDKKSGTALKSKASCLVKLT